MDTKLVMSDKTQITNYHLVRGMDLNHHGTLFAGKAALLFVEAGFIVTSLALNTNEIVCLRIHGMLFSHPVKSGDTIRLTSQIVYAGKSSVGVYVEVYVEASDTFVVDGFLTFIRVDEETGKPIPHGLILEVNSETVKQLQERYLQEKQK